MFRLPLLLALSSALLAQSGSLRERKVALVIGNDRYTFVTPLQTAASDARSVQAALHDQFGFETTLLLNATREQIISALDLYRRDLPTESSLLIYYAGHGYRDADVDKAYWWPVDARADSRANWISADDITTSIRGLKARHVLIVSDSCYSGTLTRGVTVPVGNLQTERERTLVRLQSRTSRELLASGGNEPVADGGGGGHSVFASAFLRALQRMDQQEFAVEELFQEVRVSVAGQSAQLPQLEQVRNSGDDGGEFVFTRIGRTMLPAVNSPLPPASGSKAVTDSAERVYAVGNGVKAPIVKSHIDPSYTEAARIAKINGIVILGAVVGTDGLARDITVLKGLDPGLDSQAVQALKQWRFTPGTLDGKPVAVRLAITVTFRLL
jgi:TonB family protein